MKNRLAGLVALGWMLSACGGQTMLEGSADDPGNEMICYGNPDTSMICNARSDAWDCLTMPNGQVKCGSKDIPMPDGEGGWTCSAQGETIVCVKDSPDIQGTGGWSCVNDSHSTTCTTTQEVTPPGGGDWSCSYSEIDGLTCTGTATTSGPEVSSSDSSDSDSSDSDSSDSDSSDSGDSSSTNPDAFTCSYAMVVFTYGGETYVVKIPKGWTTCTFTNQTSSDATFEYSCNGDSYSNPDFVFSSDGSSVPTYSGQLACSDFFTVKGREVWAKAGVTIIYAVAHNGSFENHFVSQCPPASGVTYMAFPISCGG